MDRNPQLGVSVVSFQRTDATELTVLWFGYWMRGAGPGPRLGCGATAVVPRRNILIVVCINEFV
jgi:hypothetical protein